MFFDILKVKNSNKQKLHKTLILSRIGGMAASNL